MAITIEEALQCVFDYMDAQVPKLANIYSAEEVATLNRYVKASASACVCSDGFHCSHCELLIEYCAIVLSDHMPIGSYTACTLYDAAQDVAIRMREECKKKLKEKINVKIL